MIDNCTLRLSNVDWEGIKGNPAIKWLRQEVLRTKHTTWYSGKLLSVYSNCSLYLKYNPVTKVLTIKNSLHKWYKGCNSTPYSLVEVEDTISVLSIILGIDVWDSSISQFEFGINLFTKEDPYVYLRDILIYGAQGKLLHDTSYKGHCISQATEYYYFKIYDKTMEAVLSNNVLRIEVRRMDAKRYFPALRTLKQVVCTRGFAILSKELLKRYNNLHFDNENIITTCALSTNESLLVMLMNRVAMGVIKSKLEGTCQSSKSISRTMKKLDILKNKYKIVPNNKKEYLLLLLRKELDFLMDS